MTGPVNTGRVSPKRHSRPYRFVVAQARSGSHGGTGDGGYFQGPAQGILSTVTEETLEETLAAFRRFRAIAVVSEIHRQSIQKGKDAITPAEVDAEIAFVRRARRQQQDPAEGLGAD